MKDATHAVLVMRIKTATEAGEIANIRDDLPQDEITRSLVSALIDALERADMPVVCPECGGYV